MELLKSVIGVEKESNQEGTKVGNRCREEKQTGSCRGMPGN